MAAVIGSLRIDLTAGIAEFQKDLGKAAGYVKDLSRQFTSLGNDFKRTGAQLQSVGLALTKTISLPLAGIAVAVSKVGMDFEDAFAGVKKTVQGTEAELDGISNAFRDMAKTIPTSATELAKIGEIAGQLGVGKENIVAFTKTISDISTATHLTADEAATSFARLAVILKVPQDQFESLGSAVYSLGNFGSSTEQEMLAMAQRIAGAGATVGLTSGQVLGLSNALSSVGVEAEAGGTAMSKILIKMAEAAREGGKKLQEFAQIAGESGSEFKQQFQTDAGGAVVAFVQGLGRIQSSGGDLLGTIQKLGFEEVRLRDATLRMANAGSIVADSVALGTKAFSDHTAFLAAVQERYKTTSNELKTLGNQIADVGITLFTSLKPAIESAIALVGKLLPLIDSLAKSFAGLPGGVQLAVIGFLAFSAALGPITYIGGQVISSMGSLIGAFGKTGVATRAIIGSLGLAEKAMQALGSAVLVDGAVLFEWGKSTVAVGGIVGRFGTVLAGLVSTGFGPLAGILSTVGGAIAALVNPVTLAIGAFVAVGVAVAVLTGHWDDLKAGVATVIQVVQDVGTILWWLAKSVIGDLVSGLVDLSKWIGGGIVSGFNALVDGAKALVSPLLDVAKALAGPVIDGIKGLASATADLAKRGISNLHEYADAVRDMAKDLAKNFEQANKGLDEYRKTITDRAIPKAAMDIGQALDLLKSQLKGISTNTGGSGFKDLTDMLASARAELAALSKSDLSALTAAVKSGAFTMKQLTDETGLSETAIKIFQDRIRENAKEMKAAQSIFDEYKKKVAELTTGLTEAVKFDAPIAFIKKQFGSMVTDVVQDATILGKKVPQVIADAFLKITLKDAADHFAQEMAKFDQKLDAQVKADLDRRNDLIVKSLGVIVEANQSTADSIAQFSIAGLQNQIKNIEAVNGATKESIALKLQLYAEEYQQQVALINREAQARKDSLDKTVAYYQDALTAIDEATGQKMGIAAQIYNQKITEMQASTKKWASILDELSGAFSQLAQVSGGAFGGIAKEIGTVISAMSLATKAVKSFNIAKASGDKAGQVAALAGGVAAVAQATSSKNVGASVVGGALTGAQVGSIIPGVGNGVGAGVGALVGYIRAIHKGPAEKAALDVGRDFGVNISEGLSKELGELRKTIGQQAASIFNLDKIIAEGGGLRTDNIKAFTARLRDTFVLVKQGSLSAADGAGVLDRNFANFANHFLSKGPLISKALVEIVKLTDDLGAKSQAVADFISSQVTGTILPGLEKFTSASEGAAAAFVKIASPEAANALSATVATVFSEMLKAGTPILEIADKLEPLVAKLGKQFEAAGFAGSDAFARIKSIVSLAADEIAGPALEAATGLGQALAGLSNIGQLNQETFTGLTDQISATFNNLVSQGYNGTQILTLMQQPLQTIWELASQFGFTVDDTTKALLGQGLAAGALGEKFKKPQDQMIDALNKTNDILGSIATALGAKLPAAAKTAADGIRDQFANVNPQVNVQIHYDDPGFTPPSGTPGFAGGSGGVQNFGSGTLAVLHGREGVYTDDQVAQMQRGGGQAATAAGDTINMHFTVNAMDAASVRDHVNRPGGIADMFIENISQGKRGRDERLRRGLTVTSG